MSRCLWTVCPIPKANAVLQGDWEGGLTVIVPENIDPPAAETRARQVEEFIARDAPVDGFAGPGPGAAR